MNERFEALWNRLRRKIDQVVIFGLVLLLIVTVGLYWIEQQQPEPPRPPVTVIPVPPPPPDWELFKARFTHPKKLSDAGDLGTLLNFNPFDARSVADISEKIARLDKEWEAANQAYLDGDLETAKGICRRLIQQMPNHQKSIRLLQVISEKERETAR